MAKNNRHNAAFVVGSVLGAVVGAGAALWKTPYTGQELREKLAGGQKDSSGTNTAAARPADSGVSATSMSATSATASERSIKDKVLSSVEKTLAPIVGVELGKTASGSDATVVKDPNIKVNTGVSSDGVGQGESVAPDGSLGLSRDRVDANEWAAAYSGGAGTATQEQPASTTEATSPSSETKAEQEGGLLRHPHRWRGYDESSSGDATAGSTKEDGTIGLSQDRVDADKWAAAYSGGTGASETPAESTESTQTTQTQAATADPAESTTEFSKTLVGQSRDQRNAARWAAAYGTAEGTSSDSGNTTRESTEQTGQGADPAFRGDDGDAERHPPVDRGMPENVAPATNEDTSTRDGQEFAADAASTEQLTTPQVDHVPDAAVESSNQGMHPFPKLGGKE